MLFETGLPPRWYIPPEDVRTELLEPSETRTGCAYKGFASYWSRRAPATSWRRTSSGPTAIRTARSRAIRDRLAFFNERVDIEVDGELQERPVTQWSRVRS